MLNLTRHFHQFSKGAMLLTTFIVAFILAGTVTPAFAADPAPANTTVNGTITAGALTEAVNTTYTFTGPPGSTATYTMPITVSDLTGGKAGWKLSITSTTLTGTAGTVPTNASTITGTTAACVTTDACSSNSLTNAIGTTVVVPAAGTAPGSLQFFGTGTGTGAGIYLVTPSISVVLPSGLLAGALSSTVTLTLATGPS